MINTFMKISEATYNEASVLYDISIDNSLLEYLLEFERQLDENHLYAYRNWKDGVIVEGPELSRHWIKVVLMYPYENMPDPEGAKRLLKLKTRVDYQKDSIEEYRQITSEDDVDRETGKAKLDKKDVWYVTIEMPRAFVDNVEESNASDLIKKDQPAPEQAQEPAPEA